MGSWAGFLLVYFLGGFTFVPLLIAIVLLHAHLTLPHHEDTAYQKDDTESIVQPDDDIDAIKRFEKAHGDQVQPRPDHGADVAAGYFAIFREYVPTVPVATPPANQSVYQSMYRSIFDRKQTASPLDNKGVGKPQRSGNVFYVVLRHGHLMLFDDGDQLEVRHVISLEHHNVSIYSGGDETPEGELFIKRNAIRLSRKPNMGDLAPDGKASKPFFLFSENCSDKEDFYFALLRNQETRANANDNPPSPLQYDMKDIITLVQRLHSSEEHLQTRWINAVIGRVFLALYKTAEVENFVRAKITKKISRVKTPSFLSKIVLRHIDMGEAAPVVTNPRLKDLTADGELIVEADVRYMGNFRIEVAATARIELGPRIKAREVNLLLAVVLKRIDGHAMIRVKPPPSNRFWVTFQSMPKIDMTIEPIVSSRQITYTVILRQIENRIKEVIAESLVFPNWDDFPFYHTENKPWRGGIWAEDVASVPPENPADTAAQDGDVEKTQLQENTDNESVSDLPRMEKSMSMPLVDILPSGTLFSRKATRSSLSLGTARASGSSTSVEHQPSDNSRALQHKASLSSALAQHVAPDDLEVDSGVDPSAPDYGHNADAMANPAVLSQRDLAPEVLSLTPPEVRRGKTNSESSGSSVGSAHSERDLETYPTGSSHIGETYSANNPNPYSRPHNPSDTGGMDLPPDPLSAKASPSVSNGLSTESSSSASAKSTVMESKRFTLAAVSNVAATAKKWGWNAIQRQSDQSIDSSSSVDAAPQPRVMGRGRPLPPPGTPLPRPERQSRIIPITVPKRKPVNSPSLPQMQKDYGREAETHNYSPVEPVPLRKGRSRNKLSDGNNDDSLLVVAAPSGDSEPTTPLSEHSPPWTKEAEELGEVEPVTEAVRETAPTHMSKRRPPHRVLSTSPEEDGPKLPSWLAAQEEEARTKSTFVDEDAGL